MADNCTVACLVDAPDFSTFDGCGLTSSIRSGFIKNFLALRCDAPKITDITSAAEIIGLIQAGKMFVSPTITGQIPNPTASDPIVENCEPEQNTKLTHSFSWESVRVDNTNLTDFAKWSSVYKHLTDWTIAPITCDNILLVPQDVSTDGVFFSMRGTIAATFENINYQKYVGELSFIYNDVINGIQLTSAVVDAIYDTTIVT
jgi:hypothetical protein